MTIRLIRTATGPFSRLQMIQQPSVDVGSAYAILSHTWGNHGQEVSFQDFHGFPRVLKSGYRKIRFCNSQAIKDKLEYFWIDTCCINKADPSELSESIVSMFRWYQNSAKCYVLLSDVSVKDLSLDRDTWLGQFKNSRWFERGWTLQELLAPKRVEFYSVEGTYLGDKTTLESQIHERSGIPIAALRGTPLSEFSSEELFKWGQNRVTHKEEDRAYCLLGIFNVYMPVIYGERENAFTRLKEEIGKRDARGESQIHGFSPVDISTADLCLSG